MLHEKVTMNRTKLLLLLKPNKEKHQVLLESLRELIDTLDTHFFNRKAKEKHALNIPNDNGKFLFEMNQVVENGRNLLYDEWTKIQSIADTPE